MECGAILSELNRKEVPEYYSHNEADNVRIDSCLHLVEYYHTLESTTTIYNYRYCNILQIY